MANEIKEIEAGARINHLVFRDVYNTTFDKDVITDIEFTDEGALTGRCKTGKYDWLPVFYHCKKGCYTENIPSLLDNGSLKNGVLAFEIGGEVKVLLEENIPKYVVGHFEQHNPPLMCMDLLKMSFSSTIEEDYTHIYSCSEREELIDGVDCHGDTPICEIEEVVLGEWVDEGWGPGHASDTWFVDYISERLVRVGPLMLILFFSGDNMYKPSEPPRSHGTIWGCWKAVWTQEREDEIIAMWEPYDNETYNEYVDHERPITYPDYCVLDPELKTLLGTALQIGELEGWYRFNGTDWTTIVFHGEGVIEE